MRTLPGTFAPTAAPEPIAVPAAVLGTMTFADGADAATSRELLRVALDAGVTWLDTANQYAAGLGEPLVGELLRELPAEQRDRLVVATKVGQPDPELGEASQLRPEVVRRSVERSLERLGAERLDLLYLHKPDRTTPLADTLAEVAALHREGKVERLGLSNFAAWQIAQAIETASAVDAPRPVIAQQMYSAIARRLDDEYAELAVEAGLATVVYNPLAGGLLTGRYRFDTAAGEGRFGSFGNAAQYRDRYWDERNFAAVERIAAIADDAGMPVAEAALRWTLSRPVVDGVLVGGSKPAQLRQNLAAIARGPLPADVAAAIDAVGDELRGPMPAYGR
ncbi:aldo/keto reductase [Agrococcus terreus]|uniref:Oxidoreductase n=1 Tax=Agrococcus terreus TaxID=574649 RepID=A0ABQ2KAQ2_9MICO|nr:aldo/keto reductase [Agrococcus terreus]GGN77302.1 oxidoreductase [Agrococcus terreus]